MGGSARVRRGAAALAGTRPAPAGIHADLRDTPPAARARRGWPPASRNRRSPSVHQQPSQRPWAALPGPHLLEAAQRRQDTSLQRRCGGVILANHDGFMSQRSPMTRPLLAHVAQAWQEFDRAAGWSCCVTPAAPILFFGDLHAYRDAPLRVLTAGLNPSLHEFPADEPFRRFPLVESGIGRKPSRYLDAMSAYFRTDPYRGWFSAFEPLLNGMDVFQAGGTEHRNARDLAPARQDRRSGRVEEAASGAGKGNAP